MTLLAETLTCLRFFSRLPLPDGPAPPLAASTRMLPVAGALLGLIAAAALAAAAALGLPPAAAALTALLAGTLASGGLHEDGLADTADGLGGGHTRERKLAIMRDSRIGSYGVLAVVFSLGLRGSAIDALLLRHGVAACAAVLVGAAAVSRALALLPMALLPPARADGLGHGFGRPAPATLGVCFALAAALGVLQPRIGGLGLGHAALALLASLGAAAVPVALAKRQIGGHTGDIAGAAQQAAEAAYLLGVLALPAWR